MLDKIKFKKNSQYLLPFITNNYKLFDLKWIIKMNISTVGDTKLLKIYYDITDEKTYKWLKCMSEKEKNIFNVSETFEDDYIYTLIQYTVPRELNYFSNIIEKTGTELLSSKDIIQIAKFWNKYTTIIFS